MVKEITILNIDDFASGAGVLGTGGGGDPHLGCLALKQKLKEYGRAVPLIEVSDLDDDAFVVPFAAIGAPTVAIEKLITKDAGIGVIKRLEEIHGRKADALISGEIGGINSIMPVIGAAELGLPVVNGDGIGRAFPKLEMTTYGIYGCSASPTVLMDDDKDFVTIETKNNAKTEAYARAMAVAMGYEAAITTYPMSGADVKRTAVRGAIGLCLDIGKTIREAKHKQQNPAEALVDYFSSSADARFCKVLFRGKIIDIDRRTEKGWTLGELKLESLSTKGSQMTINFQNENLVAYIDGNLVAIVPDLITILDSETGVPITTENLKYGQRVSVLGIACDPLLVTPEALEVCGPKAFGYNLDFMPIQNIDHTEHGQ